MTSADDCATKATCRGDAAQSDDIGVPPPSAPVTANDTPDVMLPTGASADVAADIAADEPIRIELTPSDACVPVGPEVCTNGIDDDCNGLTDCADPACSAYVCAPPAPSGWSGPVAFWQATNPATTPSCQPSYGSPLDANRGLVASAASCGACACTASGQTCAPITANVDSDTNCGTACPGVSAASGGCSDLPNCGGASFSMTLPAPAISGGTCMANSGSVTVEPASWTSSARLCSYMGPTDKPGGCPAAGDQCVLAPSTGFATTPCIYSTANPPPFSCPSPYDKGVPSVFYLGLSDTRGCSGCTCASASPSGGSCSGTLMIFGGSGCTGATTSYTLGSGCDRSLGLTPRAASVRGSFTVRAGACPVQTQAAPSGMASATGPLTVCCK